MPYRKRLQSSVTEDPKKLLGVWREERSYRVGKALCYSGVVLSFIATVADIFWSDISVILTDFVLLIGCLISLYWIRSPSRPSHYWWPLYWGFWISVLPSYWTTGGLTSPFFGISVAALYVMGTVLDSKDKSIFYLIFSFLHILVFYGIETLHPLSAPVKMEPDLAVVVTSATLAAICICVHYLLKTEHELAHEFSQHYQELARTEEDLIKSERQLKEAQSIGRIGSWEWNIKTNQVSWSDELFKIFNTEKSNFDPTFEGYLNRLNPEIRAFVQTTIQHSLETGLDYVFENKVKTPHGDRYIYSRGRVIRDANGSPEKLLGTCQDITERKLIESQLMEARKDLEKKVEERTLQLADSLQREKSAKELAENASQAKMQFLANMSHEIRTPMNSILGFSELLMDEEISETSQDYVNRIRTNGNQLLRLIDDILDLSKFEAGQIPIHKTLINLKSLIDETISSFLPVLTSKGLDLEISYMGDALPRIVTDSHRISQVLNNLLSNSIKFSEKGLIRLTVAAKKISDHKLNLVIEIEDQGIGISEEHQKNLFQPFSQGDSSVARKFGGTGLGLALSKRIAESLDGKLELKKSLHGKGSHFLFEIPVETATQSPPVVKQNSVLPQAEILAKLKDRKILLVEDSPDNAALICHYIKVLGAQVDVATDGIQAVAHASQKKYDCIFMDIQMPGMDGLEATRRIRSQGYKEPIIALTAHALPAEAAKSIQAGCDLHLTKPITLSKFADVLTEQLREDIS